MRINSSRSYRTMAVPLPEAKAKAKSSKSIPSPYFSKKGSILLKIGLHDGELLSFEKSNFEASEFLVKFVPSLFKGRVREGFNKSFKEH